MTGYLTAACEAQDETYELVIPNKEVRKIYIEQVRQWFGDKVKTEARMLTGLYEAFEAGNAAEIEEILNRQLLTTISFHDAYESFYHGFLLALLHTCADWRVTSNAETGKGRSDIKVERADGKLGFIVEVKDVKDAGKLDAACAAAIRQIEEKDYTATLRRYRTRDIWVYGIAFYDKECRVTAKHEGAE